MEDVAGPSRHALVAPRAPGDAKAPVGVGGVAKQAAGVEGSGGILQRDGEAVLAGRVHDGGSDHEVVVHGVHVV